MSELLTTCVEMAKVVHLQPGDTIALMCNRKITKEQAELLVAYAESEWPGHHVVVMPPEIDIAVVRPEEQ